MGKRYLRSPLIEAVFEFAPVDALFDTTTTQALDNHLGADYAGQRDEILETPFTVEYRNGKPFLNEPSQAFSRFRRWSEDGSRLIQYSKDLCALNALPRYSHFEDYLPAMEKLFQIYVNETRAQKTRFFGQRYINRIVLPSSNEPPTAYFRFYPSLADRSEPIHRLFSQSLQIAVLNGEKHGRVVLQLAFNGFEEGRPVYMLDLYAQTPVMPVLTFDWGTAQAWQQEAHLAIEKAFNDSLTETGKQFLGLEEEIE